MPKSSTDHTKKNTSHHLLKCALQFLKLQLRSIPMAPEKPLLTINQQLDVLDPTNTKCNLSCFTPQLNVAAPAIRHDHQLMIWCASDSGNGYYTQYRTVETAIPMPALTVPLIKSNQDTKLKVGFTKEK